VTIRAPPQTPSDELQKTLTLLLGKSGMLPPVCLFCVSPYNTTPAIWLLTASLSLGMDRVMTAAP